MRLFAALREKLSPGAAPLAESIERDIDDEFAFHKAQLEADLRREGFDDASAHVQADRRFGNEALHRRRCRAVAMKERIMLQKINVVMTIVLLTVVVVMGVMLYNAQRNNAMDRELLMSQVEALQSRLDDGAHADGLPSTFQAIGRFENAGKHALQPGMMLSECIALAKPVDDNVHFVVRNYNGEYLQLKANVTARELVSGPTTDFELTDGDIVHAKSPFDNSYSMPSSSTDTGVVYIDGDVKRPGVYNLPVYNHLTVARLLAAAGVSEDAMRVIVRRHNDETQLEEIVLDATIGELRSDPQRDVRVVADDYIKVAAAVARE